ncbi:MAG: glycosyltransferase family 4 protein [Patescibacteria group bacterium]
MNTKRRVLVATGLYPPEIGGPATYSRLLETHLGAHGFAVSVLPFSRARKYWPGIRHVVYTYLLLRAMNEHDMLYAQDTVSVGLPAFIVYLITRKRFVLRVPGDHAWEQGVQRFHVLELLDNFPIWNWRWNPMLMIMRMLQLRVARAAACVVVPSAYLARIVATWGVPPERIHVVYNGVTVEDVGTREVIRGMLHFEGRLLISVGRLVPWKGFDTVIRVFASLKKKHPDLTLFIVGSGPEEERLMALARTKKVESSVIFAGSVDRDALLRYLKAADIFVLNTSYEGLSHLVLETMSVGTPVVTTDVGGNGEVITDGIDGYLIKPNSMPQLEKRIEELLSNKSVYDRIRRAALTRVKRFNDDDAVRETARTLLQYAK